MPGKGLNPVLFFCSDDGIYFLQDKKTTMLLRQLIIPITSIFVLSACGGVVRQKATIPTQAVICSFITAHPIAPPPL